MLICVEVWGFASLTLFSGMGVHASIATACCVYQHEGRSRFKLRARCDEKELVLVLGKYTYCRHVEFPTVEYVKRFYSSLRVVLTGAVTEVHIYIPLPRTCRLPLIILTNLCCSLSEETNREMERFKSRPRHLIDG